MNEEIKNPIFLKELGYKTYGKEGILKYKICLFECSCGKLFESRLSAIKSGKIKSCGCLKKINNGTRTHGLSRTRIYSIWNGMIQRCKNKNNAHYNDYGERGINVCDRWLIFSNFIEDMHSTYKDNLTIDRIDVNGNYEPSNCRWETMETQLRNTKRLRKTNTSGYRGVEYINPNKKWRARIGINKKNIHIGCFDTKLEAAIAYDTYVISHNLQHTLNGVL